MVVAKLTIHEIRGGNQVTVNKLLNKVKNEEKEAQNPKLNHHGPPVSKTTAQPTTMLPFRLNRLLVVVVVVLQTAMPR